MPVEINGLTGIQTPGLASELMPTSGGDAVVESGSNSDGEWVRWADGTQQCRKDTFPAVAVAHSTAYAGGFRSGGGAAGAWTWPASFTESPTLHVSCSGDALSLPGILGYINSIDCAMSTWRATSGTFTVELKFALAFGRWK